MWTQFICTIKWIFKATVEKCFFFLWNFVVLFILINNGARYLHSFYFGVFIDDIWNLFSMDNSCYRPENITDLCEYTLLIKYAYLPIIDKFDLHENDCNFLSIFIEQESILIWVLIYTNLRCIVWRIFFVNNGNKILNLLF